MAVDKKRCPGLQAGGHRWGIPGVEPNEDKTLPLGAILYGFGFQLAEEGLLELEDFLDVHAGDQGPGGGGSGIGEDDVLEFVFAGGNDRGPLADLGRIEQVKDGEVLDGKNFVHAFDAEAAFLIEEIGDVRLFESGLLGKAEAGKFSCCNAFPEDPAQILLQDFELHGRSIAPVEKPETRRKVFHRQVLAIQP